MWKYTIIKFIKIQIVIFFLKLEFFSSWHFDPRKIWFVSLQIDTNVQFVIFCESSIIGGKILELCKQKIVLAKFSSIVLATSSILPKNLRKSYYTFAMNRSTMKYIIHFTVKVYSAMNLTMYNELLFLRFHTLTKKSRCFWLKCDWYSSCDRMGTLTKNGKT